MWLGTNQGLVVLYGISDTSGLTVKQFHHEILIYPNPARDYLYIENILPNSTLEIYNLSGTLVHTQKAFDDDTRINNRSLVIGSYILTIYKHANKVSKKFAVIR